MKWIASYCRIVVELWFCLVLLASVTGLADDDRVSRSRVDELIRKLDAATLADRSRAERELLELGPDVLRLLPAPELIESVSAREAVRRIRPELERRAARDSSAASLVTLNGERTLGDIVDQIASQSRNHLKIDVTIRDSRDMRLLVEWNKTPFWNCLEDLCQRAQLQWRFSKDESAIRISKVNETSPKPLAVQRAGPFWIAIETVELRAVVGDDQQRVLRLKGRMFVEPRLRPLFLSLATRDLQAITDDQVALTPWNPDAKYEYPIGDGGREVTMQWDFRLPTKIHAKKISIRGLFHCQIAAATERVVFDQLALTRGTMRRRGGVTVRIRNVAFAAGEDDHSNGEVGIVVSYDYGGPAFESHRSWMFHNAVYLETKSGVRTSFTDFEMNQQSDGAIAMDYRWKSFHSPTDQYQFVYEAPTLIINVPVDVNLADIPISD